MPEDGPGQLGKQANAQAASNVLVSPSLIKLKQEAAVKEIMNTQPLKLGTCFLTMTPPTRVICVRLFGGHRPPPKEGTTRPYIQPLIRTDSPTTGQTHPMITRGFYVLWHSHVLFYEILIYFHERHPPPVGCVQISLTAASWLKEEELHLVN
jgi:hypothetical protein